MRGQSLAHVSPRQGRSKRLEHGYEWVDATFEGTRLPTGVYQTDGRDPS